MKCKLSKGGLLLAFVGLLLSLFTHKTVRAAESLLQKNTVSIEGTYSYDVGDGQGRIVTKKGIFTLHQGGSAYDFYNQRNTNEAPYGNITLTKESYEGGRDNDLMLCASKYQNSDYDDGISGLSNEFTPLPHISTGLYSKTCVPVRLNGAYAVYDRTHNLYIRIVLSKIIDHSVIASDRPTVLQPTNGTVVDRNQGELTISWAPQSVAAKYSLHVQCDTNDLKNSWEQTTNDIENTFYTYTLYSIPAGYTSCHVSVSSIAISGEYTDYPVRDFTLINPYTISVSPSNNGTVDANHGVVILWDVIPGNRTYYGQITCESCRKPWSRTFSSTAKFRNISNLLRQLPTKNERVKIIVRTANRIQSLPLHLNIIR